MKLIGVAIVRNEADIIETFVRHNLHVLDGLTVVDHGSTDATAQILAALVAEGLPLRVECDASAGFDQAAITTRTVRAALEASGADWAFPLDADEFIKSPSREFIEQVLSTIAPGIHGAMEWMTYVPDLEASGLDAVELARGARRVLRDRHELRKVIVSRHLLNNPDGWIVHGNHRVLPSRSAVNEDFAHALAHRDALALAHLPIRSIDQFAAKVINNHLARILVGREVDSLVYHKRDSYRMLRDGLPLDVEYVTMVAANYAAPRNAWFPVGGVPLVKDPFLAPFELRYTPAALPGALALVARFAERIANAGATRPELR
jgi:glycosyltransferase involved in cell wall biosynthesis